MGTAVAPPADAVLALISAVPLILLGAVFLSIRPRRSQQVFFGAFAVLWGIQIGLANLGRVLLDAHVHRFSLLVMHAVLPPIYLFLVHFAAHVRPRRWSNWAIVPWGATAVVASVFLILRPELAVSGTQVEGNFLTVTFGQLSVPLYQVPFFTAFYFAILVLYIEYRRAPVGTARHRVRGLLLALVLFTAYQMTRLLTAVVVATLTESGTAGFSSSAVKLLSPTGFIEQGGLWLVGVVLLSGIGIHLLVRPPPPEGHDWTLLLSFAFPAGTGIAEGVLLMYGLPLETIGFWRLLAVGVIVYTLARYQLLDLDLKLKRVAGPGVAFLLLAFGVPISVSLAMGEFGARAILATVFPEIVGVGAVLLFNDRIGQAIFPSARDTAEYAHERKLELYRAALEDRFAHGATPDDLEFRELRARFGINESEHELLLWLTTAQATPEAAYGAEFKMEAGQVVLERYRLDRPLGAGTVGRTWLAWDLRVKREIAVKAVSRSAFGGEAAKLLLREARIAAAIHHPHVIRIFDVAETPEAVLLVMDYADHGNLQDYLGRRGKLPLDEATRFLDQLLQALDAIHRQGIVHRNLKPPNVLIEDDGSVRVADFGAAIQGAADETAEGSANPLLSVLYLSPEQVRGQPVDERADLYTSGALFYQALTGRYYLPIAGKDDPQIRELILHHVPKLDIRHEPAWFDAFIERALAKNPEQRFPSAAAMRTALAEAAAQAPVQEGR